MSTTVVIGGGVIGLCCAHELARRGERVVVLEGEKPGAASWASGGWVVPTFSGPRPATLLDGLRRRLTQLGADLRTGVAVTNVRRRHSGVVAVVTTQGDVAADRFLLAAGVWSNARARRCGFMLPVQAAKGYCVTVPSAAPLFRRPIYLSGARIVCSPFPGASQIAGWLQLSGINPRVGAYRIEAMAGPAARHLPGGRG